MEEFEPIVLDPGDQEKILQIERQWLEDKVPEPVERELLQWNAVWRPEALAHHLALGWCFGLQTSGSQREIRGYFMAQPILYFGGMTQTLWVEHVGAGGEDDYRNLIDLAKKVGRDKRMQKVVIFNPGGYYHIVKEFGGQVSDQPSVEIKTTKF